MPAIPADFKPHFRHSPATDPWEPLYSRVDSSRIELLFEVRQPHCNSRNFLHGGVLASLCDNAMGLSLGAALAPSKANIVTVSLGLDFLGSAKIGEIVLITPRVIRSGGSLGFCDALVTADERIVARANAVFSARAIQGS